MTNEIVLGYNIFADCL